MSSNGPFAPEHTTTFMTVAILLIILGRACQSRQEKCVELFFAKRYLKFAHCKSGVDQNLASFDPKKPDSSRTNLDSSRTGFHWGSVFILSGVCRS